MHTLTAVRLAANRLSPSRYGGARFLSGPKARAFTEKVR